MPKLRIGYKNIIKPKPTRYKVQNRLPILQNEHYYIKHSQFNQPITIKTCICKYVGVITELKIVLKKWTLRGNRK